MREVRFIPAEGSNTSVRSPGAFSLIVDNWDDFHYRTSFQLRYHIGDDFFDVGMVKIATVGMSKGDPHTKVPRRFSQLSEEYFSLGQDREYYENVMKLPNGLGPRVLSALQDVAASSEIFNHVRDEPAFEASLTRSVPPQTIEAQFRRIVSGQAVLTSYEFSYSRGPETKGVPALTLDFRVVPGQVPPTNVHVLIGPNGVGKSQLLRDFVLAATQESSPEGGNFRDESTGHSDAADYLPFVNVIHVGFSAFDKPLEVSDSGSSGVRAHPVGLIDSEDKSLEEQFEDGLKVCLKGPRRRRWANAMHTLNNADALLADEGLDRVVATDLTQMPIAEARDRFAQMSSGHKIVVLTVTRLVQRVEEQSLVLIDEPETHLHPPLLSALTRAVSDLLIDRNGVAVVATHSPVVLQEVPRTCVWVLRRVGEDLRAEQLTTESFGESVSRLTAEVFHLDVRHTGYHHLLDQLLERNGGSADVAFSEMEGRLGSEGRFILHALAQRWHGSTDV